MAAIRGEFGVIESASETEFGLRITNRTPFGNTKKSA